MVILSTQGPGAAAGPRPLLARHEPLSPREPCGPRPPPAAGGPHDDHEAPAVPAAPAAHLPIRWWGAGETVRFLHPVCMSTRGCVDTALPVACATSAAVRFRTLALTLKVTAGPRTLEETRESSEPPQHPAWLLCGHTENTHTLRTRVRPLPRWG